MNTAVLFTGNIRSFDQCKETYIREFSHLNPDYYVTTYDTRYNFRSYVNFHNDINLDENSIRNFFLDINPKHIIIDNLSLMVDFFNKEKEKFDYHIIHNGSNDKIEANHFLQFYKIKTALDMISEYEILLNKKYDVLIRSRMDLIIKDIHTLDLSNLENSIIVGYEEVARTTTVHPSAWAWNDFFTITTVENMKKVIDNLLSEFYVRTIEKSSWGYPHGIFESGIIKSNLNVINKNILSHIIRYDNVTELVT